MLMTKPGLSAVASALTLAALFTVVSISSSEKFHGSRRLLQLHTESEDTMSMGPHGEIIETSTFTLSDGYKQLEKATHTATTHVARIHKAAKAAASSLLERVKKQIEEAGADPDAEEEANTWFGTKKENKPHEDLNKWFAPVTEAKKDSKTGFSYRELKEDDEDPDADDDSIDISELKAQDEQADASTQTRGDNDGWFGPTNTIDHKADIDNNKHWSSPITPKKASPKTKDVLPEKKAMSGEIKENPLGPPMEQEPAAPVSARWVYFEDHKVFVVTVLSCLAVLAMIVAFAVGKLIHKKKSISDLETQYSQISTRSPVTKFTVGSEEQV